MRTKYLIFLIGAIVFQLAPSLKAQVTIVNCQLMPYNITPEALLNVSIINNGSQVEGRIITRLFNISNEQLIVVRSYPFVLQPGTNNSTAQNIRVAGAEYLGGSQSEYIKTTHNLPSGSFRACVSIILSGQQEPSDEYCDEIESDFNQFLYLIYPFDKDTVETTLPLLTWNHSEPFSALGQGEFYRMIVSEIKDQQNSEEAISVNTPLMVRNNLSVHNLQYPYDAKELQAGKRYAWQVLKMANNIIINKTEAWEFVIRKAPVEKELKYVALKQIVDANYYTSYNGKIYFKFSEEYNSKGRIVAFITSDKGKEFPVVISRDEKNSNSNDPLKIKILGDNRFVLDLDKENVKPGFYILQVKNEKKEIYYLKFYLTE
jgi:hypothetical protein